eukprot:6044046-Amphidinium_carterae.1
MSSNADNALAAYHRMIAEARVRAAPSGFVQPWERGLMGSIFGGDNLHSGLLATPPPSAFPSVVLTGKIGDPMQSKGRPACELISRKRVTRTWAQSGHTARDRAIERWRLL